LRYCWVGPTNTVRGSLSAQRGLGGGGDRRGFTVGVGRGRCGDPVSPMESPRTGQRPGLRSVHDGARVTATTSLSGPTTTDQPRMTITAPIPGGRMAVNAGLVSFTHLQQTGEKLTVIANWYFEVGGEAALYAFNQAAIGPNPDHICPGDRLTVTMPASDVPRWSRRAPRRFRSCKRRQQINRPQPTDDRAGSCRDLR
jgi:hypothetical protein